MRKIITLLMLLVSATSLAGSNVSVDAVRLFSDAETSRVVLGLSDTTPYRIFTLSNPHRIVIDIPNTRFRADTQQLDYSTSVVQGIRSGPRKGGVRVVLDLKAKAKRQNFLLQPNGEYGHRLVIDLQHRAGITTQAAARPIPATSTQSSMASAAKNEPRLVEPNPTPQKLRDIVIAIDAGHGGKDPGAKGYHGTQEKEVVLAIARQLAGMVQKEPGMQAVMIRNGDYFLRLRERVAKAREQKADLLVSIHADAFDDHRARGSSVYVLSQRGATSEQARWLAEKENESDLIGGVSLDNKDEVLKSVLLDLSQTATIEASVDAGSKVLWHLKGVNRLHRHQVEQAGFVVLKSPDIPSLLVETAFISNPEEEKKLLTPRHQYKLAAAIMAGIRDYFSNSAPPGTQIAAINNSRKHVITRGDTLSAIAWRYGISVQQLRVANGLRDDRLLIGNVLRIPPTDGG